MIKTESFATEAQSHREKQYKNIKINTRKIFAVLLESINFIKSISKISSVSPCLCGIALLLFCFILFAGNSHAQTVDGIVKAVYDGDTILLATRNQSKLKVRLYGIDAPETKKPDNPGQSFGGIAKRTLMYKIMGRQVQADIMETDQYQRAVAVIRYGGRDINREMVAEGMAWAYRNYLKGAYASEYIDAEERARFRHLGLWRESNPLPPWEFRRSLKGGKGKGKKHDSW